MAQRISFLAHTRSRSFDYSWIYGLKDRNEEKRIADFLLSWLGSSQLANLPPVSAFLRFKGQFMLLLARQSAARVDTSNRPIFERAFFYWSEGERLTYRHVRSLYFMLMQKSEDIFRDIPNDEVRPPRNVLDFDVKLEELEAQDERQSDNGLEWVLPDGLEVNDLLLTPLVVETPPNWGFPKLIQPIVDMPIFGAKVIFIGSALPVTHRFDVKVSWIISPPGDDLRNGVPRVVNEKGKAISEEDLRKLTRTSGMPTRLMAGSIASSGLEEVRGDSARDISVEADNSLAKLFESFACRNLETVNQGGAGDWVARSFGFGKDRTMRDALIRLSLLIVPLELDGGADLVFAWTNLLAEISLFNTRCSPEIGRHWTQRLRYLGNISSVSYGRQSKKWSDDFKAACADLEELIGFRPGYESPG